MSEHAAFLKAFLRSAGRVGAVAPSSPGLASLMVDWLDWAKIDAVVEYGAGTGVFTEAISARLKPEAFFLAIERDPNLTEIVQARCPEVTVVEDCVTKVDTLCHSAGITEVDAIVCGLPWASFSLELQDQCLESMFHVLPPGGKFATFAYWQGMLLPAGRRFRRLLRHHFSQVEISPTAWSNLPPAFVYRCVR